MARVQSVAGQEFEEERHRRAEEVRAGRARRFAAIDVGLHDIAVVIDVVAVKPRAVILVLADDTEFSSGRAVAFAPGGDGRRCDLLAATKEPRALFAEI